MPEVLSLSYNFNINITNIQPLSTTGLTAHYSKMSYEIPKSDPAGWRLVVGEDSHGQQKWVYLPEGPARDQWKQNKETRYWMGLDIVRPA